MTKPFLPLELVARVKAQLRRYERYGARTDQPAENMSFDGNIIENTSANGSYDAADGTYASNHAGTESDDTIICRGILLKKCAHECYLDGDEISLTPTEFTILQALCEAKGRVLSAEELFHIIWKDEYYSKSNNTITVHIRHLREKLKDTGERPKYIKTIWGVGYFTSMTYEDARDFYWHNIGNHFELIFFGAIALVFCLMFYFFLNSFTKYFQEIDNGINALVHHDGRQIRMSKEMAAMEEKLNSVNATLNRQLYDIQMAEKKKDELVLYLAHDIRTPLTSVIGYLKLLEEMPDI